MRVWAIVVAAGSGARFANADTDEPKQYLSLRGVRVVDRSVQAAKEACEGVVLVVPAADVDAETRKAGADVVVAGGDSRSASVRNGLGALISAAPETECVLVHDAARPLASKRIFSDAIQAIADGASGAVPVVPVTDTLRTVDGEAVDRSRYVAVQTPQAFSTAALVAAHDQGVDATDDATLLSELGYQVRHVEGSAENIKITYPMDLVCAEAIVDMALDSI